MWGQCQDNEFRKKIKKWKNENIRESHQKFNAPVAVLKEMYKLKILKLKDFIKLQNIFFINLNELFQRKSKHWGLRIYFFEKPLEFFLF